MSEKKFLSFEAFKQACINAGEGIMIETFFDINQSCDYSPVIVAGIKSALETLEQDNYSVGLVKSLGDDTIFAEDVAEENLLEALVWFQEDLLALVKMGLM